jgi:hypothetical protein
MQRLLFGCAAILVAVFGELGCQGPTLPANAHRIRTLPFSAKPANTAGLSAQEINVGRKLFIAKCARCHPLYDPSPYSDVEWSRWMTKMSKKARLKPVQEDVLRRYLGAFRAPQ